MSINYGSLGVSYLAATELPALLGNVEGNIPLPYADSRGIATIGIGVNLSVPGNMALVLSQLGLSPTTSMVADFESVIAANPIAHSNALGTGNSTSEKVLQAALNLKLQSYGVSNTFQLTSNQAYNVTTKIIQGYSVGPFTSNGLQNSLDILLANNGISSIPHDSPEYEALMSMFYNSNGGTVHNNIIGPTLLAALQNGNRAEAWYQIRYKTNPNSLTANPPVDAPGIASRRYAESAEFGLYDPGTVTSQEALAVYQMYTKHAPDMIQYDKLYGGAQNSTTAALQSAATALSGLYGTAFDPLNIFDTSAPGSIMFTGTDISRVTDTTADLIIGGEGNDTLTGGTGADTFVYMAPSSGSTTETIDDSLGKGNGSVYVGTTQLTGGDTMVAANTWTDGNGDQYVFDPIKGTLTISQGLLGSAGNQVIIDNFDMNAAVNTANGYLGIKFQDLLGLKAGASPASPFTTGTPSSQTASANGDSQTFTLSDLSASTTAQTVTLALTGGNGTYDLSTGANDIPLTGTVNLVIPAGQDSATFSLIDTSPSTMPLVLSVDEGSGRASANDTSYATQSEWMMAA